MLEEIYLGEFGIWFIVATLLSWVIGIIAIVHGKNTKDTDDVQMGLAIIFFGSIPFLNGFALAIILFFIAVALMGAALQFIGKFIAALIVGEKDY